MSLYTIEKKNIPVVKEWGYTPIQGFADEGSFGVTDAGDLVHIADTSTWAGVFKNGLSVVGQYELKPPPKAESVVQTKNPKNPLYRQDYDELFLIIDALDYKEKKVKRGPLLCTPLRRGGKKRAKEARAKKKESFKKQSNEKRESSSMYSDTTRVDICRPNQLTCRCYQCVENPLEYTCDFCGKADETVHHVNSRFAKKWCMVFFSCYQCEQRYPICEEREAGGCSIS